MVVSRLSVLAYLYPNMIYKFAMAFVFPQALSQYFTLAWFLQFVSVLYYFHLYFPDHGETPKTRLHSASFTRIFPL